MSKAGQQLYTLVTRPQGQSQQRYEIKSDLNGPYWNEQISGAMMQTEGDVNPTEMMKDYFHMEASKSTPQYGFRKGLEVFNADGWNAAVSELKDNLIGRDCIKMLGRSEATRDILENVP